MTNTRIIPCPSCLGDKGHEVPYDINRFNGDCICYWQHCSTCGAEGDVEIELEEIEMEDLDECYGIEADRSQEALALLLGENE